jgi:aminopeptidase YwaD
VIARLNAGAARRIVITAHIDAYQDSPGASDNASGTVVLLLCAELLSDYRGEHCVEIAALNGEDHYGAGGQMDYLRRYGGESVGVLLAVNIDGVGYKQGKSAYSFYECPAQLEKKAEDVFQRFDGLVPGEQWFSGDHMIFVQGGVPAVAFTSERVLRLMRTVTHTSADTTDIIDCHKLVEVAESLSALARSL